MEPRIQYAKTEDGVSIAYWTMGEGRPLVCLPPFGWSHLQLEWQDAQTRTWYEELAERRRLVRYDPRGNGLSERNAADLSFEAFLEDVDAVAKHLELDGFALYGAGPNTPHAIACAAAHPGRVTQVILWQPQLRIFEAGRPGTALIEIAEKDWRTYTESAAQGAFGWSESDRARTFAMFIRESVNQETWVEMARHFDEVDVTSVLSQVSSPTLVLARPQLPNADISHVSAIASQMQNARVVFLAGSEPVLQAGDIDEGLRAIEEFLGEGSPAPEPSALPEGTAIILFLDIAGSTALTERLGDTAFRARAGELDASLRAAIGEAGGTPVEGKVLGDGVMAVFTSAREAIDCALRCRMIGDEAGLPLHLGIHAGDVLREGTTVYGGAVNLAQRITDASAPGEILVSDTLRGLARTSTDVSFEDRGERELKGIEEPQQLWAVVARDGEG